MAEAIIKQGKLHILHRGRIGGSYECVTEPVRVIETECCKQNFHTHMSNVTLLQNEPTPDMYDRKCEDYDKTT